MCDGLNHVVAFKMTSRVRPAFRIPGFGSWSFADIRTIVIIGKPLDLFGGPLAGPFRGLDRVGNTSNHF